MTLPSLDDFLLLIIKTLLCIPHFVIELCHLEINYVLIIIHIERRYILIGTLISPTSRASETSLSSSK